MKKQNVYYRKLKNLNYGKIFKRIAGIAVVAVLIWLIFQMNLFYVSQVEIRSQNGDELEYVDGDLLAEELTSYEGKRIFSIDTKEIKERALQLDPFIELIYVTKRIPDTLVIRIVEKQPAGIVREGDVNQIETICSTPHENNDRVVDSNGQLIATCGENTRACVRLPLFIVEKIQEGTDTLIPSNSATLLYDLVNTLREEEIEVSGFGIADTNAVVVSFPDMTRGVFSIERIDEGVSDFFFSKESLSLEAKTYKEIDVRFDRPVVRVDKYTVWVLE